MCHNIRGGGEGLVCSHIYACRKRYGQVKNLKWDYGLEKKNDNLKKNLKKRAANKWKTSDEGRV